MTQQLEELVERVRRNEDIARKLFDIEIQIMNLDDCRGFFGKLLDSVQDHFQLDAVWVALNDTLANESLIRAFATPEEVVRLVVTESAHFFHMTKASRVPILTNQPRSHFHALIPPAWQNDMGSMAILPLIMENRIIGSLNLGSRDTARYSPDKDSYFLHQLAVKASICLASVAAREQIKFLATRDALTHLRNRREMEDTLEQELSRSRRYQQPLSLVFIDCDDFKLVNDTYGHDVGDLYLRYVADTLVELLRRDDLAFRFAGDEFVLLLPNQNEASALFIAERIAAHLRDNPLQVQDQRIPVMISFGAACTEGNRFDGRALIREADKRLYEMKALKPSRRAAVPVD